MENVQGYINRVRAIAPLDAEEEYAIAIRASAGDVDARETLIQANLRHVVSVALKYRRYAIPVSELISEGHVGLMIAARKFKPELGNRFVTYAGYWIRAYVLDAVVRSNRIVGSGSGPFRSKVYFRLRRERAKLANRVTEPTEQTEILAKSFGVTVPKMEELLQRLDGPDVYLDAPFREDSSHTLLDRMEDTHGMAPEEEAIAHESRDRMQHRIGAALGGLDERERYIVNRRFFDGSDSSLAAIGRDLGVSRERARQLEARAKEKLKNQLGDLRDLAA